MDDYSGRAETLDLRNDTLNLLPNDISIPNYDRSKLTAGIVHIGVGNFHRAHQAWYLHRLMQDGRAHDWAVIGAGVRQQDSEMRDKLLAQDCLATLIELAPESRSTEVCGSMIDFLPVEQNNVSLIAAMSAPEIRIVSLTITEGGYYYEPSTGKLDQTHPDILHDLANPDAPRTAFGAMVAALKHRRAEGHAPFTALSCDNLQGNGNILREVTTTLAGLNDPELAEWIDTNGAFPNSMVDCIVPASGPAEIALSKELGINDAAPVTHENFRQWVIEDNFCAGRPKWEDVGATLTETVHDYESMKIRVLNAGHQILANSGELLGQETIADCMSHPLISSLFAKVQKKEIAPHVTPVPGITSADYVDLVEARFSNPAIRDTTRRVAFDGSSRHPGFVLQSLRDGLAKGTPISGLALVEAIWARMCAGTREDGSLIEPNDPNWSELNQRALEAKNNASAWLEMRSVYAELGSNEHFAQAFSTWLKMIWNDGVGEAIEVYLDA